jgi:hypothetical protein
MFRDERIPIDGIDALKSLTGLDLGMTLSKCSFISLMIFKLYIALSALVFLLAIGSLCNDSSDAKARLEVWLVLILAIVLSPITLPNMVWSLLQKRLYLDPSPFQYDHPGLLRWDR